MQKDTHPFGEKHVRDLALLNANDEYKADMEKLSKKYNLNSNSMVLDGKKELEFIQDSKSLEMTLEYIELLNKYNMGWLFYALMPHFVDKGYFSVLATGEQIKFDIKEATKHVLACSGINIVEDEKEFVTLKISKDATAKDVQKMWLEIKNNSSKKGGRKKTSQNQARDLEILRLRNKGLKAKEIVEKINGNPKYADQKIPYQEVYRIISRLKTRAKNNIPHRDF